MRTEIRSARRWLAGWAAALALVSGSAGAAALTSPYVLQGFEWGDGSLEATAGSDGSMLFVSSRNDLNTSTVRRYGKDGLLAGTHSMAGVWSDIAANRLGNYVVANVTAQGVYATVFNRNGAVVVPRFQASTRGETLQVSINDAGLFVVAYNAYTSTPTGPGIFSTYARVFNSDGSARTGEILIASGTDNQQSWALGMDGAGVFVVNQMRRVSAYVVEHRLLRYNRDGAQLSVQNDSRELLPGGYASVRFDAPLASSALSIPPSALIFNKSGTQVATLGKDDRVVLKPISVGRDLGNVLEIASGIDRNDRVIANPPDGVATGDAVRVAAANNAKGKL